MAQARAAARGVYRRAGLYDRGGGYNDQTFGGAKMNDCEHLEECFAKDLDVMNEILMVMTVAQHNLESTMESTMESIIALIRAREDAAKESITALIGKYADTVKELTERLNELKASEAALKDHVQQLQELILENNTRFTVPPAMRRMLLGEEY